MMKIIAIPALSDNYIWALIEGDKAIIVDPGDASPVVDYLHDHNLTLTHILLTHHHSDHVGGVAALCRAYDDVIVYGPDNANIKGITHPVSDGATFTVTLQQSHGFEVIAVPGHTLDHIAYLTGSQLFCGDTLFSLGCGRLFEGTPEQMYNSLSRIAALPAATQVYCAHEYTTSNIAFTQAVCPDTPQLEQFKQQVSQWREQQQPSLPSTLAREQAFNPFLRVDDPLVINSIKKQYPDVDVTDKVAVFAALRQWKDNFRP